MSTALVSNLVKTDLNFLKNLIPRRFVWKKSVVWTRNLVEYTPPRDFANYFTVAEKENIYTVLDWRVNKEPIHSAYNTLEAAQTACLFLSTNIPTK